MEADDNRIVLRARNVTKTYAGVKVLDDVLDDGSVALRPDAGDLRDVPAPLEAV